MHPLATRGYPRRYLLSPRATLNEISANAEIALRSHASMAATSSGATLSLSTGPRGWPHDRTATMPHCRSESNTVRTFVFPVCVILDALQVVGARH